MRDYFAEFLLNPGASPAPPLPPKIPRSLGQLGHPGDSAPIKHHVLWAITAGAIGIASWKASQWFASHKFLSNQAEG